LSVNTNTELGALTGGITLQGSELLTSSNAFSTARTVDLRATSGPDTLAAVTGTTGTYTGVLSDAGALVIGDATNKGAVVLTGNNTYSGGTTLAAGVLSVAADSNLGASSGGLTLAGGELLTSANGFTTGRALDISPTSGANTLAATTGTTATYTGVLSDTGALVVGDGTNTGTVVLTGNNTYSGGTFIAAGAGMTIGSGTAEPGTGSVIASNNVTIGQPNTGSSSSTMAPPITTVPGATVTFTSSTTANNYGDQFFGAATSTNIFLNGIMSIGGAESFSNFLGTVIVTGGTVRMFNALGGGDNTTFIFTNAGGMFSRDANQIHLGALFGDYFGHIDNPSVTPGATYQIGGKNINSVYSGEISGSNNIVKIGTGTLTFNGNAYTSVGLDGGGNPVTNTFLTNGLSYTGFTTVSNGTLQLVTPATLTNAAFPITLASSTAVLDATQIGYVDSTGLILYTNGDFEVVPLQSLSGVGTVKATNVLLDAGSTLNVGLPTGLLTVTANQGITLGGVVNMNIDPSNSVNSELSASSFTVLAGASLNITNINTNYANTVVYHMFNSAINTNNFTGGITLPVIPAGVFLTNRLSLDGTLVIVAPASVNLNPTNILTSVSPDGTTLNLSWPADHKGWQIQIQTNSLAAGFQTNNAAWFTLVGTELVTSTNLLIDPKNGTVFYRMYHP
jgi:autotransporter-associated beta strand protein